LSRPFGGVAALRYSTCLFVIYFPLASLVTACSFPSFFGFSSSLPFYNLARDFEFASFLPSYFLPTATSLGAYFYVFASFLSGALLSFLLSFSLGFASLGFYFLSPAFLSSFFSYFLSTALVYCFSGALGSLVTFSIDPFPSFLGSYFTFLAFLSGSE
jgi:hypothetical protein